MWLRDPPGEVLRRLLLLAGRRRALLIGDLQRRELVDDRALRLAEDDPAPACSDTPERRGTRSSIWRCITNSERRSSQSAVARPPATYNSVSGLNYSSTVRRRTARTTTVLSGVGGKRGVQRPGQRFMHRERVKQPECLRLRDFLEMEALDRRIPHVLLSPRDGLPDRHPLGLPPRAAR